MRTCGFETCLMTCSVNSSRVICRSCLNLTGHLRNWKAWDMTTRRFPTVFPRPLRPSQPQKRKYRSFPVPLKRSRIRALMNFMRLPDRNGSYTGVNPRRNLPCPQWSKKTSKRIRMILTDPLLRPRLKTWSRKLRNQPLLRPLPGLNPLPAVRIMASSPPVRRMWWYITVMNRISLRVHAR